MEVFDHTDDLVMLIEDAERATDGVFVADQFQRGFIDDIRVGIGGEVGREIAALQQFQV